MRFKFIVNPVAGRGDGEKKWKLIEATAVARNLDYTASFTQKPGDGVILAKEGVSEGFDVLVAVGGDGTVNEVVRGIIDSGGKGVVKLGIVPCGTGNDLVRSLNIPLDVEVAVDILERGKVKNLDLGKLDGGHFINVVGIGFDAAVAYEINSNVKRLKGAAAYVYGVFKTLFQYKCPEMTIHIDEQVLTGRFFLVAIANARYYGGGMMIAPTADPEDGVLDICVVKEVGSLEVLKVLPSIFSGKHVNHWAVSIHRGKKVVVESAERVLVQADGELKGTAPMTFELEAGVFPVLVPAEV